MSDTPEFRYTTLGEGDGQLAGIMDARGVPARGRARGVVDLLPRRRHRRGAAARSPSSAARSTEPAQDTPYGRLAAALDPTGARFKLMAGD